MEQDENRLASLFPDVATQLRVALSNLHLAAAQLAPAEARENDPALDQKAALLDQSYYRLLRLVNSLSSAAWASTLPTPPPPPPWSTSCGRTSSPSRRTGA